MNLRKKLKKFFTLKRRPNDGFTLVELIVVIAIMGILGGAGTVGYSGYIRSANKKADIALVGNVMRAIETGIYSHAFGMEEKLQLGKKGVQIPIGFVLLSEDGTEALESATTVSDTSTEKCVKSSNKIKIYSVKYEEASGGIFGVGAHGPRYVLNAEEFYYCTTHSDTPASITISQLKSRLTFDMDGNGSNEVETTILDGSNWNRGFADTQTVYLKGDFRCQECGDNASSGKNHYSGKEFESIQSYGGDFVAAENGPISQMLQSAFAGEDMSLKYKDWSSEMAISSFYSGGTKLWEKVESLGNSLVSLQWVNMLTPVTSQSYTSAEHVVTTCANKVSTKFTDQEKFYEQWKLADDSKDEKLGEDYYCNAWGFGLDSDGREFYCAVRVAYNEAFAAYVESTTPPTKTHSATQCANNIRGYGENMFGQNLPKLVCRSSLKSYGTNDGSGKIACEACYELYEQYVSTGVSKANCYAFYDTMVTVKDTAPTASSTALGFFDYYDSYLEEFEGLYDELQTMTNGKESAIVVTVYLTDGEVTFDVLPLSANPRNE